MTDACDQEFDFEIGYSEEDDYNCSFARLLQEQGGNTITNRAVTTSPELESRGDRVQNGNQDVVFSIRPLIANGSGWAKVKVDTDKIMPGGITQVLDATILFKIVEHRTNRRISP